MNDVVYRINTALPVTKFGTVVTGAQNKAALPGNSGTIQFYKAHTVTLSTEVPGNTGLVDRFDDPTYYTA